MTKYLQNPNGLSIAYNYLPGNDPAILFLPGFFSHMQGTKALWLEQRCRERGQAFIRFDYRGHGESGGSFEEATITDWLDDTLLVLDRIANGPVILVGSSMGGWISILAALARPEIVTGVVGIAAAPDFTQMQIEEKLSESHKEELLKNGLFQQRSDYWDTPLTITRKLIENGKHHGLLHRKSINLDIPVCLIHGKMDPDIPWETSLTLQQIIGEDHCDVILLPDGEHRLSREEDLVLIDRAVSNMTARSVDQPG